MRLQVFHPIYAREAAISHICMSLCAGMEEGGLDVRMVVPGQDCTLRRSFVQSPLSTSVSRLAYRFLSEKRVVSLVARSFLRSLQSGDVVYLWPGTPRWVYEAVKDKGLVLVMERINTHRRTAKAILDDAYARLGLHPSHQFTEEAIADEDAKLALADLVFSPSPAVTASLVRAGIEVTKIIQSSYGWDPVRLGARAQSPRVDGPFTALFMGRVCVRKGAHHLLEAWAGAGVAGKLVMFGRCDEEIERHCRTLLNRKDVDARPYTSDVASAYASADAFIFPTLEEGSPLVVYEAMASWLPIVTTPMGGGELVRNEQDGFVVAPHDVGQLIEAIRRAASDRKALDQMRRSARDRAQDFTWSSVGQRRANLLRGVLALPA